MKGEEAFVLTLWENTMLGIIRMEILASLQPDRSLKKMA
jgi:hypothetical protein